MEIELPSGRKVNVERYDENHIVVTWTEKGLHNQILAPMGISKQDLDKMCQDYLYGYTDPETGEKIPGVLELIKEKEKEEPLVVE